MNIAGVDAHGHVAGTCTNAAKDLLDAASCGHTHGIRRKRA